MNRPHALRVLLSGATVASAGIALEVAREARAAGSGALPASDYAAIVRIVLATRALAPALLRRFASSRSPA
jgi:hypothetical protein